LIRRGFLLRAVAAPGEEILYMGDNKNKISLLSGQGQELARMSILKEIKLFWVALAFFTAGLLTGLGMEKWLIAPVSMDSYLPDDVSPRYTVNISQTIEYGLIYSKTDMVTGETRMYVVKNGKLKPFLSDTSN
jgi:hypothetical protein